MAAAELMPEQEARARHLARLMEELAHTKITEVARLLASRPTKNLFGQTELLVRDLPL